MKTLHQKRKSKLLANFSIIDIDRFDVKVTASIQCHTKADCSNRCLKYEHPPSKKLNSSDKRTYMRAWMGWGVLKSLSNFDHLK